MQDNDKEESFGFWDVNRWGLGLLVVCLGTSWAVTKSIWSGKEIERLMSLAEVILMGLLVAIFLFATLRSLWRLLRNKRADLHAASEDLEDVSWQELIVEGIVPSVLFACLYWWLYFVPKVEGLMGFDIWVMLAFIPFYRMVLRGIRSRLFPILCGFRPP